MLHASVSAYKQAGAEQKSDPICQKVGGGGTCMHPGRGSRSKVERFINLVLLLSWPRGKRNEMDKDITY